MKMGIFDESVGVWAIKIGEKEIELKPDIDDFRTYRKVVMLHPDNKKDKNGMYSRLSDLMFEIIKRDYPEEQDEKIKVFIEKNINVLFEESMIFFKWTTRDKLDKAQKEEEEELKKAMSGD